MESPNPKAISDETLSTEATPITKVLQAANILQGNERNNDLVTSYRPILKENEILGPNTILILEDSDWKELNVPLGHKRAIVRAARDQEVDPGSTKQPRPGDEKFSSLFEEVDPGLTNQASTENFSYLFSGQEPTDFQTVVPARSVAAIDATLVTGHIRLTDFGLSKEGISSSSSGASSFCGTPEYLAPEIVDRRGHGRAVDWWSLGALLYEMLTGSPPFYCQDREILFQRIRTESLRLPPNLSPSARSVLRGLLTRDPDRRLGSGPTDAEEIKAHNFFSIIDWEQLATGSVVPPWKPPVHGMADTSQFDKVFTEMPIFSPSSPQHYLGTTPAGGNHFDGFSYTNPALFVSRSGMKG